MLHGVFWSTNCGDDGGNSRRECFEHGKTERIGFRWEHEKIHIGDCAGQVLPGQHPREFRVLHVVSQPGCLCTLPNHNHSEIPMAAGAERLLKLRKPADVLLNRESSHVADGEGTALAVPKLRTEKRRIYAMGHQETGLAGRPLEPLDHFLVWREQQSRDPVKTCCCAKAPVFNRAQQSGGRGLGQE